MIIQQNNEKAIDVNNVIKKGAYMFITAPNSSRESVPVTDNIVDIIPAAIISHMPKGRIPMIVLRTTGYGLPQTGGVRIPLVCLAELWFTSAKLQKMIRITNDDKPCTSAVCGKPMLAEIYCCFEHDMCKRRLFESHVISIIYEPGVNKGSPM